MTKDCWKQAQAKDIAIGGRHCPCCFDLSIKKKLKRMGRRRFKRATEVLIKKEEEIV